MNNSYPVDCDSEEITKCNSQQKRKLSRSGQCLVRLLEINFDIDRVGLVPDFRYVSHAIFTGFQIRRTKAPNPELSYESSQPNVKQLVLPHSIWGNTFQPCRDSGASLPLLEYAGTMRLAILRYFLERGVIADWTTIKKDYTLSN